MKIDLTHLYNDGYVCIDGVCDIPKDFFNKTDIIDLKNISVKGNINRDSLNNYIINIIIKGIMVLPCAVTLKPVDYKFEVEVTENFDDFIKKNGKNLENNEKTIDILPIIWENILMEIPIRVVCDDVTDIVTSGDGWDLIVDDSN